MKLGIVTDSTSDLPADLIQRFGIEVIPTILVIEGKQYADGEGISRNDFYARLPMMKIFPTTAAPSIGEFSACYQKLFNAGCDHILSIHAASKLTAICDIARQAAADFPNRITVVDSGSLSLGIGFQALAAAEVTESGADTSTALAAIESTRQRLHVFAALDTMDFLRRSGRIPAAITFLGGMLNIRPLVELTDGQLKPESRTAAGETRHPAHWCRIEGAQLPCATDERVPPRTAARYPHGQRDHGHRRTCRTQWIGLRGGQGVKLKKFVRIREIRS
jgi:DegV family protein with EDD domain